MVFVDFFCYLYRLLFFGASALLFQKHWQKMITWIGTLGSNIFLFRHCKLENKNLPMVYTPLLYGWFLICFYYYFSGGCFAFWVNASPGEHAYCVVLSFLLPSSEQICLASKPLRKKWFWWLVKFLVSLTKFINFLKSGI